jgi:hypothetical protein
LRDSIHGVTKGDIRYVFDDALQPLALFLLIAPNSCSYLFPRRIARRGGVKRISATIYDDVRAALKQRLQEVGFKRGDNTCGQLALTKL